jgi:hypothetical protein
MAEMNFLDPAAGLLLKTPVLQRDFSLMAVVGSGFGEQCYKCYFDIITCKLQLP